MICEMQKKNKEIEELKADSFYDEMMRQKAENEKLRADLDIQKKVNAHYYLETVKLKGEFAALKAILDRLRQALPGSA